MHHYEDGGNLYYEPFQFVSKNLAPLISNIELKKKKSDLSVIRFYNCNLLISHLATI